MTEPTAIETHSAHWGFDDHRYFGYAAFGELLGQESLTGLNALSILGRRLPPDVCAVLDDAAVAPHASVVRDAAQGDHHPGAALSA